MPDPVSGAIGGSAVLGAVSADNASDAQAGAAAQSDATQRYMYDQTREDNAPFRDAGVAANNQLAMLLGLNPDSGMSRDQIRNELLGSYTTTTPGQWTTPANQQWGRAGDDNAFDYSPTQSAATTTVNESGLNSAIEQRMAEQARNRAARSQDPQYGSLMRKFSTSDMNADPVYQSGLKFGLDQGTQGINRQAAAGGNFLSGATLKALTRFGNDYGSTKANESYNRFNTDQNAQYNKLAGMSGAGQQATNQVSAAGQNMANNVSQSQQAAGNARASGYMGQANALSSGVNSWMNYNQNQNMIDRLYPQSTDYSAFAPIIGGNGR